MRAVAPPPPACVSAASAVTEHSLPSVRIRRIHEPKRKKKKKKPRDTDDHGGRFSTVPHDSVQGQRHGRSMLGRGVKRKWSCLDELEPELLPVTAQEKKQDEETEAKANELLERQVVLGLCLEKLQRYQAGVELSLRRSVLLVNTLRQLQEDMRSDGAGDCTVQPEAHHVKGEFGEEEEEVPVTCRGCADGEDLPPPPTPSSEFISQESNGSSDPQKTHKFDICSISDAVNAMGYLSDLALDDIFEDIDTSMYETTDLSTAVGAGSLWPVSMSLLTDDEIKLCPPAHSSSPGSLPSCLMDLSDLDHLMEILIKS